mmetsp:Transcript_16822/g.27930  ORF Transcript_16822/g.27930 Transcript_16822/m.27930 type:complete len:557 (-) Transcript_16822:69-1739(-)|eukprot:CAMPEP_0119004740 /NCGR_PEP_ID=MMETSP1176-20130426/1321_1 /TAXON_ID=265551 /ORGANISM="Synedropsis recta cf, Strain CCMP1620" /LENGTH=556 /DNA_ID=CAMNT_0006956485 /DNA_START=75 /DNA_END=1745 /DNA_ORIENTATION=-
MMFKILALSALIAQASADPSSIRSRRLSYQELVGYEPRSQVTDHAAIALDQAQMEVALGAKDFELAKLIYNNGGSSKSFAVLTITGNVPTFIKKRTPLSALDDNGNTITGVVMKDTNEGAGTIQFQYDTSDNQDSHVGCQVGALAASAQTTTGCLVSGGSVTVNGGAELPYSYDPTTQNTNGRTLAGFSRQAKDKLHDCDEGDACPYVTYTKFYNYYKNFDYGHIWVSAGLDKTTASFEGLGSQDIGSYADDARIQTIQKGTAYMNVWMYVIREMEDALDDCKESCIGCNDEPVHAWDEAVAFYAGSLEGPSGSSDGNLLYRLADKRCTNFKTCGEDENQASGTSKMNIEIMRLFNIGQNDLLGGQCGEARKQKEAIEKLMAVPLVQGTLRYAFIRDYQKGTSSDKEEAEGAVFAASVLPIVHACDAEDAQFIYDNMRAGFGNPDFKGVKAAFERNYECMGMTCSNVGGLLVKGTDNYQSHAEPCSDSEKSGNKTAAILGGTLGALCAILIGVIVFLKCRKGGANGKDNSFVEGSIDPSVDVSSQNSSAQDPSIVM